MRIATLSPSLFLLRATREAAALARKMATLAAAEGWAAADGALPLTLDPDPDSTLSLVLLLPPTPMPYPTLALAPITLAPRP